jgi:hypothetical protein
MQAKRIGTSHTGLRWGPSTAESLPLRNEIAVRGVNGVVSQSGSVTTWKGLERWRLCHFLTGLPTCSRLRTQQLPAYRLPARRRSTKKIVPAGATKGITEPFPPWKVKAVIAAFSGSGPLRAKTSTPCIGKGADVT